MGRYDKIKVYHNGTWKTPTQCRVYANGAWQDLGTATSYNTKSMYVRKNGSSVRATLNRRDQVVVTDRWAEGRFYLLPASGYCRCSQSSGAGAYNWYFRAYVEKTTNCDQYLFYCGTGGNPSSPGQHYVRVTWLSDGRIRVDASYSGTVRTMYSSNAVGANTNVYLNVYSNAGSYSCTIDFNGVTTTASVGTSFRYNGSTTTVGDTYTKIRGTLSAAGVDGSGYTHSCSFNAATASGSDGSQYSGVTHRESTRTDVYYE